MWILLFSCNNPAPPPEDALPVRLPDVLLIVEDTMRADALHTYGNPRETSPVMNTLAKRGVRFADVTSPGSWTWPTHASLFTGLYPWEHGAHFSEPIPGKTWILDPMPFAVTNIRDDVTTLAERFADAGYRTVSVSGNKLIGPEFSPGLVRGFETSIAKAMDAQVVNQAVRAMDVEDDDRPLFLFVNLFGAHAPHDFIATEWNGDQPPEIMTNPPPWAQPFVSEDGLRFNLNQYATGAGGKELPGYLAHVDGIHTLPPEGLTFLRDLYEGEVLAVDTMLGAVLNAWSGLRAGDNIVAVTSDHGEYFGEHGLLEHGRTIYPEVTRVPLLLFAPGRLPADHVVETPVEMHQLHDTLLALTGIAEGPRSLLPLINQEFSQPIRAAAWADKFWSDLIGGPFKLNSQFYREGDNAVILWSDDTITTVSGMEPPDDSFLERAKAAFPEDMSSTDNTPATVSPETLEWLEAMGYTGDDTPEEH